MSYSRWSETEPWYAFGTSLDEDEDVLALAHKDGPEWGETCWTLAECEQVLSGALDLQSKYPNELSPDDIEGALDIMRVYEVDRCLSAPVTEAEVEVLRDLRDGATYLSNDLRVTQLWLRGWVAISPGHGWLVTPAGHEALATHEGRDLSEWERDLLLVDFLRVGPWADWGNGTVKPETPAEHEAIWWYERGRFMDTVLERWGAALERIAEAERKEHREKS